MPKAAKGRKKTSDETPGLKLLSAASVLQSGPTRAVEAPYVKVQEPTEKDILCGRGGRINHHLGNIIYRRLVEHNKPQYKRTPKRQRMLVSQSIVQTMQNYGSRFLQQTDKGEWESVVFRKAVQKTSQALRERPEEEMTTDI